jgi:hypothetical protein
MKMAAKKLNPSVEKFKSFVKEHPGLIQDVRRGDHTWQELFEDWYLLGDEDPRWHTYQSGKTENSEENKKSEKGWMNQIGNVLQKMDADQMQNHINSLSQAIAAVQGVLAQFQGSSNSGASNAQDVTPEVKSPFSFRKD